MGETVSAWHPPVPQLVEVLHATFETHTYPAHTHDAWTILLIDDGAVTYELDRARHQAGPASITVLPPHVPHDGRTAQVGRSFRKRVLYLERDWLTAEDAAASDPLVADPRALAAVTDIHAALAHPADTLAAECGVIALGSVLQDHYGDASSTTRDAPLARRLRILLDDTLTESVTIAEAARTFGVHPSHLVRTFSQAYGIAPHRYVTGRRVDLARRLLLGGSSPADVAVTVGFHDQAHLTRHFRRVLGTTPAAYAA